jgi:hypothetical protein
MINEPLACRRCRSEPAHAHGHVRLLVHLLSGPPLPLAPASGLQEAADVGCSISAAWPEPDQPRPVPVPVPVPDLSGDGDGASVPDLPGGGDAPLSKVEIAGCLPSKPLALPGARQMAQRTTPCGRVCPLRPSRASTIFKLLSRDGGTATLNPIRVHESIILSGTAGDTIWSLALACPLCLGRPHVERSLRVGGLPFDCAAYDHVGLADFHG